MALGCLMDEISYELREHEQPAVQMFVEHLRLAIQLRYTEQEASVDAAHEITYVRLTTIHAAKGLEYPVVIVPGMQRLFRLLVRRGWPGQAQAC